MNKFFRKSKSPSPKPSKKANPTLLHQHHSHQEAIVVVTDESSTSEPSITSPCNTPDDVKEASNAALSSLKVPKSVRRTRTLSFDGMLKTLNQLSSKDLFLKIPFNDRRLSCGDSEKDKSSADNTLSASILSIEPNSPKSPPVNSLKCVHCMHLASFLGADNFNVVKSLGGSSFSPFPFSSNSNSDTNISTSDFSDTSENHYHPPQTTLLHLSTTITTHNRHSPPIIVSAPINDPPIFEKPTANRSCLTIDFQSSTEDFESDKILDVSANTSICSNASLSSFEASNEWQEAETLQVPLIKPRSSSLDANYQPPDATATNHTYHLLQVDADALKQHRSTSVDVSLPTDESFNYKAILPNHE